MIAMMYFPFVSGSVARKGTLAAFSVFLQIKIQLKISSLLLRHCHESHSRASYNLHSENLHTVPTWTTRPQLSLSCLPPSLLHLPHQHSQSPDLTLSLLRVCHFFFRLTAILTHWLLRHLTIILIPFSTWS